MKRLILVTFIFIIASANAQSIQQSSQCPSETRADVYTVIATDTQGNIVSTNFQSYCKPIQQQQQSSCPEGTEPSVYTVTGTDLNGVTVSTDFQSYCKPLQRQLQQGTQAQQRNP